MSSIDINLASASGQTKEKTKKLKNLKIGSLALLFLVGVLSVVIFLLNLSSPINSIKVQQDAVLASITASQEKAVKIAIVNERVSSILKIYKERSDYTEILDLALSSVTGGIRMSGLNIDKSSVAITVFSTSLLSLNNFLNSIIDSANQNSKVNSVSMESLSASDASGAYTMSIKINLK